MSNDNYWHPIREPHPNGKADGVELMDVSGRIYQASGEVCLDGTTLEKPITPDRKALAWRIASEMRKRGKWQIVDQMIKEHGDGER